MPFYGDALSALLAQRALPLHLSQSSAVDTGLINGPVKGFAVCIKTHAVLPGNGGASVRHGSKEPGFRFLRIAGTAG